MNDYLIRAVSNDGSIRAFGCYSKTIADTARQYHGTSPVATAAIGRLLTAASMMGAMLKGEDDLVTLQMTGSGPMGRVLATGTPDGCVKGYVGQPLVDLRQRGIVRISGYMISLQVSLLSSHPRSQI